MSTVDISVCDSSLEFLMPGLERVSLRVLEILNLENWEFSLFLCDNSIIQTMNRQYRDLDEATDVLSFSQDGTINPDTGGLVAGDVVISYDMVQWQAKDQGIDPEEELIRVLIHGILHLAGMDHPESADDSDMIKRQEELVRSIKGEGIF